MWCKVDHTHILSHANFLQKCRYFQSQITRWVLLGKKNCSNHILRTKKLGKIVFRYEVRYLWLGQQYIFAKSNCLVFCKMNCSTKQRITYISFNMLTLCKQQYNTLKILFPLKIVIPEFLSYFHTLFSVNNIPYREFLQQQRALPYKPKYILHEGPKIGKMVQYSFYVK